LGRFLELRTRYLQGRELVWFGAKGEVAVAQPDASYGPADRLMDDLYDRRNRLAHGTDFNKIHVKRTGTSKIPGRCS
jgi:hypothetical protein